jgi:hypothetical protein
MTTTPTPVVGEERGAREHRRSLFALIAGIPLAWLVAGTWSLIVGTSDFSGTPRVTGTQSLFYDVPGYLLLVGAAVTSLVYSARALRHRAHGSAWGLWASAFGVFVTVLMTSTVVVDTLLGPEGDTWLWIVRAGSVVVAVAAALVARAWASNRRDV